MSLKAAADVAGDLGVRFNVLGILPLTALATFVAALVAAGAPGEAPRWSELAGQLEALSGADVVVLSAAVLIAALVLHPLQLPLVRLLEGYWGNGPVARRATAKGVARQRRRRARLDAAATPDPTAGTEPDAAAEAALVGAAWRLRHAFPPESRLLPTTLGNVLRAAEHRAGRPYGLDAVVVWPRLYPVLDAAVKDAVDDLRLQLDVTARLSAMFVLAALASAALLATHGWWLAVPAVSLVLAAASYRAAVSAAGAYGLAVETAFDLTHLDLRKSLGLPRPPDRESERAENRRLTEFFRGVPTDLRYDG